MLSQNSSSPTPPPHHQHHQSVAAVHSAPDANQFLLLQQQKQQQQQLQQQQQQFQQQQHQQQLLQQQQIQQQQQQHPQYSTTAWQCQIMTQVRQPPPLDDLTRVIYTLLMPVVCVLGAVGATICILVFTRRQMRSSLNIYLAGLSAFDLILLLMSLLIYPSMNLCLQEGHRGSFCHFFWRTSLATYPLSLIAQTGSVWTCVAITVDRFLAVQYPLHMRAWCTPRRARIVLNYITIVAILYKMPSIFELSLDECGRLRPTQLRNHPLYIIIYNTYGYLLLLLLIPFFVIIVLNIVVVSAVRAATIRRRQMQNIQHQRHRIYSEEERKSSEAKTGNLSRFKFSVGSATGLASLFNNSTAAATNAAEHKAMLNGAGDASITVSSSPSAAMNGIAPTTTTSMTVTTTLSGSLQTSSSSSLDYDKRCTKMAIVTIVTFVLFNWLAGVNNVIEAFDLDVSGNSYRIPIGNLLVCLNSATNILIYSIFGQRFRKMCAALLCPCFRRKYDTLSRSGF